MAIDPVFSSPSAADPPPQRSRAPQTARESRDFALPDAQDEKRPAPDKSAATRDSSAPADAKTPDAGKGDPPAAEAKSPGTAVPKPSDGSSAPPAAPTGGQVAAGQKPQVPATDIGAIASILAAAEEATGKGTGTQAAGAEAAEAGTVPLVVKPGKKKAGDEAEVAGPAPEPASAPAQAAGTVAAAPDLAILPGTGATAVEGQSGAEAQGEAGAVPVGANTRGATATVLQHIGKGTPGIAVVGGQPAEAGKVDDKSGGLPAAQLAAKGHAGLGAAAPAKTDAGPAPLTQPSGQPAQAESKLSETLQQALAPIDLSALVAQASGKPAAAHPQAAALLDPAAAQAQPAPQAQANGTAVPTPLHLVPIEIGMRALAGAKSFDIRLDPAELGRVDVNLSISDKGEVRARLVVDRVETLHLLQRDARTLERAFEQAGLKPSDSGVDITLRDNSDQAFRQQRQQDEAPQRQRHAPQSDEADAIGGVAAVAPQSSRQIVRLGGVDLSI
ncbi:flagellar hook-length control protein FliK [Bosea sp. (in: a-proteobacteria)]|uniref:flagellar hook-length control protein FliK n=1 Tax=Bosea sp. (in: a-proteobacteria) TaxID=1871050 RepID=UPI00120616A0|nr:flagellar hook-length control protein FliK [Bosea sp. (in: a-proteobacteria)]TAJ31797.1 MAG: hypothetical protein EPO59_07005 [Bosea sp. (in: a-proteobacteria)]